MPLFYVTGRLRCNRLISARVVAEQVALGRVLVNGGETASRLGKTIVRVVVVGLADLAQQGGAVTLLRPEAVVKPLRQGNAFAVMLL